MTASGRGWRDAPEGKAAGKTGGTAEALIGFLKAGGRSLPAVRIETGRSYLRPPQARDWAAWATLREESRAFLTPWEPTWPADALGKAAFMRRLKRQTGEWRRDEGYSLLLFDRQTDRLQGGIGFSNVRRGVAQMASVGYWVGERFAGAGLMTEALRAAAGFAFTQLGFHRIEAVCLPTNERSRRLLARTGFVQEGYARAYLRIDGTWQDHLMFGLLRRDFERAERAGTEAGTVEELHAKVTGG